MQKLHKLASQAKIANDSDEDSDDALVHFHMIVYLQINCWEYITMQKQDFDTKIWLLSSYQLAIRTC